MLSSAILFLLLVCAASTTNSRQYYHRHAVHTASSASVTSRTSVAASTTSATGLADPPTGSTSLNIQFSGYTSGSVSDFLSTQGISISDYRVASTPSAHTFVPGNVAIADGKLRLTVTGGAIPGDDIACAEVTTNFHFFTPT